MKEQVLSRRNRGVAERTQVVAPGGGVTISLDQIQELVYLPPVTDPGTFGRDWSNPYYDFLYHLAQSLAAGRILELGTFQGASTSYLAAAVPEALVISVDIYQPDVVRRRLANLKNLKLWQSDTRDPGLRLRLAPYAPFDLVFFDTLHEYELVSHEFSTYRDLIRPGGVAVFDDIHMNAGMSRFWEEIEWPKVELPHLHLTGFGAAVNPGARADEV